MCTPVYIKAHFIGGAILSFATLPREAARFIRFAKDGLIYTFEREGQAPPQTPWRCRAINIQLTLRCPIPDAFRLKVVFHTGDYPELPDPERQPEKQGERDDRDEYECIRRVRNLSEL